MDEFDLIARYLAPLAGPGGLGLKDDAALLTPPPGKDIVLTADTMVEGVHFLESDHVVDKAGRLLRSNLSDLAAKGATPAGYLLSLALPKCFKERCFSDFCGGLKAVQEDYKFELLGGDTVRTNGPMVITAAMYGYVDTGAMVRRDGAQTDDDIWVSGTIGDAYLGLQCVMKPENGVDQSLWVKAYQSPEPRFGLRDILHQYAHAALDVSDGLIADAGHIARASGRQISINSSEVPLSNPTKRWLGLQENSQQALVILLTAGDDYEIVFTAATKDRDAIEIEAAKIDTPLTRIGNVKSGEGVMVLDVKNRAIEINRPGYSHF